MPNKIPVARFEEGQKVMQKEKHSLSKYRTKGPKKGIIKKVKKGSDKRSTRFEYEVQWNNSERTDLVAQHRLKILEE